MKRLLIAIPVMCASMTGSLQAAAVYSQVTPDEPVGAYTSTNRQAYQKIADDFLFSAAQPVTVRSLRVIGGYTSTSPPPITPPLDALPADDFRVLFLNDAAGTPGTVIAGGDFAVGTAERRHPTDGSLLNGVQYPIEYSLDLGEGITLNSSTVYWVSILNDPGADYGWQWARANGSLNQQIASTEDDVPSGPWGTFSVGGMFFAIDDANVPEPDSTSLLLAGIGSLVGIHFVSRSRVPRPN